jgi:hypothetical protein
VEVARIDSLPMRATYEPGRQALRAEIARSGVGGSTVAAMLATVDPDLTGPSTGSVADIGSMHRCVEPPGQDAVSAAG